MRQAEGRQEAGRRQPGGRQEAFMRQAEGWQEAGNTVVGRRCAAGKALMVPPSLYTGESAWHHSNYS